MNEPLPLYGELLALGSALAWAVGVILFRVAGRRVHPVALNLFKNGAAFLLYPPTMLLLGMPLLYSATPAEVGLLLLSGVLGMGLSDTFLLMALNRLGAGLLAILTVPYTPLVALLSLWHLDERLTTAQAGGIALVVLALLLVAGWRKVPRGIDRTNFILGALLALGAMTTMAVSIVMIKPLLERTPLIWATEVRLGGGLLFLGVLLAFRRDRGAILATLADRKGWSSLIPGTISGTYVALLLMLGGVKHTLATVATALNQTANLFIFVLAVLLLREPSTPRRWAGLLLGLAGAGLVIFGSA